AGSLRRSRFRQALIVSEVALSVVLLAGAGLLFRSFMRLQSVNAGFEPRSVLTARISPSGANFKEDADYMKFYQRAVEKISAIPGVNDVGAINTLPLAKGPTLGFRIEGRPIVTPDRWPISNYRNVTPNYFRAMGVPVLQGRAFTDRDNSSSPLV